MQLLSDDVWSDLTGSDKKKSGMAAMRPGAKKPEKPAAPSRLFSKGTMGLASRAEAKEMNPGTVRATGAGYSGAKGEAPKPAARSAKMDAGIKKPSNYMAMGKKAAAKAAAAVKPAKSDNYNRRSELGDFYLNATSGMFSEKAGGKKKK